MNTKLNDPKPLFRIQNARRKKKQLALYRCGIDGCDGMGVGVAGHKSFDCPICHTVQKVIHT